MGGGEEQKLEFGQEIILQNDAFHKLKNSRKERAAKFRDSKINSQKLSAKLEDLKICGLQQIALQFGMTVYFKDKRTKQQYIDLLDPKIRSLSKIFHLTVGEKQVRLGYSGTRVIRDPADLDFQHNENKLVELKAICRQQLTSNDIDTSCIETNEALDEAIDNSLYVDRNLVTSKLLKLMTMHGITVVQLQAMKLKTTMSSKQSGNISLSLKKVY